MILGHVARICLWAYIANMVLTSESWAYFDPNRNGRLDRVWLSLLLGHSFFLFLKFFSNWNFRPSTSRKSTLSLHFRGIDFDDSSIKWIIQWVNYWRENGLNFSLVRDRKRDKSPGSRKIRSWYLEHQKLGFQTFLEKQDFKLVYLEFFSKKFLKFFYQL